MRVMRRQADDVVAIPRGENRSHRLIEVIQFGDYECKECGLVAESLQAFRHRHDGLFNLTYMHFPSLGNHAKSLQAAEAAESARAQGRFWQMHNRLMRSPGLLRLPDLYAHAESIGFDMSRFTADMDEGVHVQTILQQIQTSNVAGVQRTLSYLVDGVLVDGGNGIRALIEVTNQVLSRRRLHIRSGR